jgi:hypothetical protein
MESLIACVAHELMIKTKDNVGGTTRAGWFILRYNFFPRNSNSLSYRNKRKYQDHKDLHEPRIPADDCTGGVYHFPPSYSLPRQENRALVVSQSEIHGAQTVSNSFTSYLYGILILWQGIA